MSRIYRGNWSEGQPDGLEQRHRKGKEGPFGKTCDEPCCRREEPAPGAGLLVPPQGSGGPGEIDTPPLEQAYATA